MGYKTWSICKKLKVGDSNAKAILLYLALVKNEETGRCYPSQETIAEDTELSLSTVKRKLKYLVEKGYLQVDHVGNGKQITGTFYQFHGVSETPSMVSEGHHEPSSVVSEGHHERSFMVSASPFHGVRLTPKQKDNRNKEEKERKKENIKRKKERKKTGSRISENFQPSEEMLTWARSRAPDVDLDLETEKFINYWSAKSGKDATKLDWPATWRNWILNAKAWSNQNGKNNGHHQQTPAEIIRNRWYYQTGSD